MSCVITRRIALDHRWIPGFPDLPECKSVPDTVCHVGLGPVSTAGDHGRLVDPATGGPDGRGVWGGFGPGPDCRHRGLGVLQGGPSTRPRRVIGRRRDTGPYPPQSPPQFRSRLCLGTGESDRVYIGDPREWRTWCRDRSSGSLDRSLSDRRPPSFSGGSKESSRDTLYPVSDYSFPRDFYTYSFPDHSQSRGGTGRTQDELMGLRFGTGIRDTDCGGRFGVSDLTTYRASSLRCFSRKSSLDDGCVGLCVGRGRTLKRVHTDLRFPKMDSRPLVRALRVRCASCGSGTLSSYFPSS